MSVERVLLSNQTAIIYKLNPGVPDPNDPRPEGVDTRKRVPLEGAAATTSGYYGMEIIRDHIGENSIGFDTLRKAEVVRVEWLNGIKALKLRNPADLPNYLLARAGIHKTLLANFGKNPEQEATDFYKTTYRERFPSASVTDIEGFTWQSIFENEKEVPFVQQKLLEATAFCVMAGEVGLMRSSWIPGDTCVPLVDELKKHGPMLILGGFGEAFYAKKATPLKAKIEGETIYHWEVGSKRVNQPFAHAVVLIGAQKVGGTERVYFVHPDYPSDPNSTTDRRRIFAISYTNLRASICSLNGMPMSAKQKTSAAGYALYNPSFKPQENAST
jgi:hypothetical protein